jgi:tetratricopeptide (TPR) repeat protein
MAELTSNILYNMGTCYFILMSFRYAIKFYDQAILIKPNYVKAIHNRALCHLEGGDLLSAYNDIKLAYNYDKHNISIQNDLKKI